jgi:hypothetical protein
MEYTINTKCNPENQWWQPVLSTEAIAAKRCYVSEHATYAVLNATTDNDETRHYRSVVLDSDLSVLSIAPPKSIPNESFMDKYPDNWADIQCSEIVEGTMINLFYDAKAKTWEIATKGCVGGNNHYFRTQYEFNKNYVPQLSFRQMFLDALGVGPNCSLNDVPLFQKLDNTYIYSFVVQHPYNHLVLTIDNPAIYLVAVFRFVSSHASFGEVPYTCGTMRVEENQSVVKAVPLENVENVFAGQVKFPIKFVVSSYEQVQEIIRNSAVGVMLYNATTGDRTTLVAPEYSRRKEIRGNHPNSQYQFLELVKNDKYSEFISEFPMYQYLFGEFERLIEQVVRQAHFAYMIYFIKKRRDIVIDKPIFCFIHRLHNEVFIPSQNTLVINKREIRLHFYRLAVKEQFYLLNYKTMVLQMPQLEPLCRTDEIGA